tara:strand:+ start:806 stop:1003 length:198 start_codon:yes stop_codon:yes gene_type:complete
MKKYDYSKIKPLSKPRKDLSLLQKRLMNEHKKHHSKEHLSMMRKLMKEGYCFQQAHSIVMKLVGK